MQDTVQGPGSSTRSSTRSVADQCDDAAIRYSHADDRSEDLRQSEAGSSEMPIYADVASTY